MPIIGENNKDKHDFSKEPLTPVSFPRRSKFSLSSLQCHIDDSGYWEGGSSSSFHHPMQTHRLGNDVKSDMFRRTDHEHTNMLQ